MCRVRKRPIGAAREKRKAKAARKALARAVEEGLQSEQVKVELPSEDTMNGQVKCEDEVMIDFMIGDEIRLEGNV